jgi:hypothetical protein
MDIRDLTNQVVDICDDYEPGTSKDRGKMYEEMAQRIYDLLFTALTGDSQLTLSLEAAKIQAEQIKTQVDASVATLQAAVDAKSPTRLDVAAEIAATI